MSAVTIICDFCGEDWESEDVSLLISTPNPPFGARAHICDACVDVCAGLVKEHRGHKAESEPLPAPAQEER